MGMVTSVGGSLSVLSSGESQRILIAHAIAAKPRILMFDEATNSLDTQHQSHVMASIQKMFATKFVIAHRLSTLAQADRIYVLAKGRVTQEGTYNELANEDGAFRHMVLRQMAT